MSFKCFIIFRRRNFMLRFLSLCESLKLIEKQEKLIKSDFFRFTCTTVLFLTDSPIPHDLLKVLHEANSVDDHFVKVCMKTMALI